MSRKRHFIGTGCLLICFAVGIHGIAAQGESPTPKSIDLPVTSKQKGELARVAFKVENISRPLDELTSHLHSSKDVDDPTAFVVVLSPEALAAYRKLGVVNPAALYMGRTIRVDGKIVKAQEPGNSAKKTSKKSQNMAIVVSNLNQIEVVYMTIDVSQAEKHMGEYLKVAFQVDHAMLVPESEVLQLHSLKDLKDPKCFTVVVSPQAVKALRALGIQDPATHFKGKSIVVEGMIYKSKEVPGPVTYLAYASQIESPSNRSNPKSVAEENVGGKSAISTDDKDVVAVAKFAVEASPPKAKPTLVKILKAESQVVAGRNYYLTLDVRVKGGIRTAQARVWVKLDGTRELTKWDWSGEVRAEK